jgi:preprotein translocase subunit YajC
MKAMLLMMDPSSGSQGGFASFLPLLLVIVVFYFFFIRPQMKKSKDQRKFRESLQKGDKVVTIGGIHGKILEVADTTVIIEVEGLNRLKVEKSAVAMQAAESGKLEQNK